MDATKVARIGNTVARAVTACTYNLGGDAFKDASWIIYLSIDAVYMAHLVNKDSEWRDAVIMASKVK